MKKPAVVNHDLRVTPISELIPHPSNARKHDDAALDESLAVNGFYKPVLASTATGRILAGHGTVDRAKAAGMAELPVYWLHGLSLTDELRILASDNRTSDLSPGYDEVALAAMLDSIQAEAGDLEGTGFDAAGYDEILASIEAANPTAIVEDEPPPLDKAAELQAKWKTERGQIWTIPSLTVKGKAHRLMCGDSTDKGDVERLMDGQKAGLMNTDPPYGVSYDSAAIHEHGVAMASIANDSHEGPELQAFLEKAFRLAAAVALRPNAAWYLWHAMLTQGFFAAAAAAAAHVILHRQIIWVKPILVFGRGQYHWKHELCFMGWIKGNEPPDYGDHKDTTVWEVGGVPRDERKDLSHPTPKPCELFQHPITKHLKPGELAYEPFAGSGPQFVAAEQLGRLCYGLEIDPGYCAVILERVSALGLTPALAPPSEPPLRSAHHAKGGTRTTPEKSANKKES